VVPRLGQRTAQCDTVTGLAGAAGWALARLPAAFGEEPGAGLFWLEEPDGCVDPFFRLFFF